ncbi:ATP-binding protein [Fontisphaera persica]|uniref:ATP-binding protein n=1 Tax=Fontisphaera persica TaxID=2974023 RepID=UPI0024C03553|nr:ATP-binding protein [Fontisphaera persica]WCJ58339.1 ATP-binding protein [Fontisphaera persica]
MALLVWFAACAGWTAGAAPAEEAVPGSSTLLTNIQQVRKLPLEMAARGLPVRVQGVVTYADPAWRSFFIQDETAGIYVGDVGNNFLPMAGDWVELEGITLPGHFAPIIGYRRVERLGIQPLPNPVVVPLFQLVSGAYDSQWVEVEGVIRAVYTDEYHLRLKMAGGGYNFDARIPRNLVQNLPQQLINSRVRVQAACGTIFNNRRQAIGMQLFIPSLNQVRVLIQETMDPFTQPAQPISGLLRFNPDFGPLQRVKVAGVVTLRLADGSFFVQDKSGGVRVRPATSEAVKEGNQVEVVGFPVVVNYSPELVDAQFRHGPPGTWPAPVRATLKDLMTGDFDGQRVELEGELADISRLAYSDRLAIRTSQGLVDAVMDKKLQNLEHLKPGSRVRVTGVCWITADEQRQPRSVVLAVRALEDIVVVASPPWWTLQRAAKALVLLGVSILLGVGYVALLRRQVRHQTKIIREQMAQVSQLETRYRHFLENAAGIYYQVDPATFKPVFFHGQVEKITGYPEADFNAHRRLWWDLIHPEDRTRVREEGHKLMRQPGYVAASEYRILRADGTVCWVQDIARNQPDAAGQVNAIYGAIYDISARKRAEEEQQRLETQLRQAQKMEAIGQLAAGVAHDFNNILTVIQGNASFLEEDLGHRPELLEACQQITEAANRAGALTRKLLLFSRKQAMQAQEINLNELVSNLTKILGRLIGEHIHLQFHYGPGLPAVLADPGMLDQVIVNLAVNARDAMPDGGTLTLATSAVEFAQSDLSAYPERRAGEFVCLTVTDTGCGMTPEVMRHIFEPFFTTKEPGRGTGLGLATVYGVVKQHQGWVEVESQAGKGTTFRIFLPAQPAARPAPVAAQTEEAPSGGTERLLVVEDEAPVRMLVGAALQRRGYQVVLAASGPEALERWEEYQGRFDLLLTDMVMPQGMTGLELGRRLRAKNPELKIIYMSGYSAEAALAETSQDLRTRFLAKPYATAALLKLVRDVLDGRPMETASAGGMQRAL